MREPTIVARRCHAIVGTQFLVTPGEILLGNPIEIAKRRRQAIAAMLFGHTAQRPQRILQAFRKRYEAFAAQHLPGYNALSADGDGGLGSEAPSGWAVGWRARNVSKPRCASDHNGGAISIFRGPPNAGSPMAAIKNASGQLATKLTFLSELRQCPASPDSGTTEPKPVLVLKVFAAC